MAAQVEWASGEVPLVVHYAGCTFCRCTAVVTSLQHHCPELRTVDSWQPTLSFHLSVQRPASQLRCCIPYTYRLHTELPLNKESHSSASRRARIICHSPLWELRSDPSDLQYPLASS